MALNDQKYRTGGGFGGAFSTTMSGGQKPGSRKSAAPGGISLRGPNAGMQSGKIRPAPGTEGGGRGVNWGRVSGVPQGIDTAKQAYDKGGIGYMIGSELTRGAGNMVDSFVQATAPAGRAVADFGKGVFQGLTGQDPAPAPNAPPVEANAAGGTTAQVAPAGPQVTAKSMLAEQNAGFGPEEVSKGVFFNEDNNTYSGSAAGTTQFGEGPSVIGGRTPQEQQAIQARVGQFQNAINTIRGLNEPDRMDRLNRQANQSVSLNQGLGGFLNQASQRNYARDRIKDIEANNLASDKLSATNAQNQFDNQIAQANLQKGVFDATYSEDSDGNRTPVALNTVTGEISSPQEPAKTYSPQEAQAEAESIVDKMLADKSFLDSEEDVLGMTREAAIQQEIAKLMGGQQQQAQNYSQEDLEYTAKEEGMTVEEVKAKLGVR